MVVTLYGEWSGDVIADWEGGTVIHAEQTRSLHLLFFMGPIADQPAIDISWQSEGRTHAKTYNF